MFRRPMLIIGDVERDNLERDLFLDESHDNRESAADGATSAIKFEH